MPPQRKYFDPDSGEEISPTQLAQQSGVKISDAGWGQMYLNKDIGTTYTGFGAPPTQPRALPSAQPTHDIPERPRDAFFSAVNSIKNGGVEFGKAMMDPEALAAAGAGALTASRGTGFGALASGAAAGGTALARDLYGRATDPEKMKQPASASIPAVGEALLTGGLGELTGRGLNAVRRPAATTAGNIATDFFGKSNVMPQQMTDSAPLNFIANIAKHGPGGQSIIKAQEEKQSEIALGKLMGVSHDLNPNTGVQNSAGKITGSTGGISIDSTSGEFNPGVAGQKVQQNVQDQLKFARQTSGYPQFEATHGKANTPVKLMGADGKPIIDEATGLAKTRPGKTVKEMQAARSDALALSRKAYAANDLKLQSEALKQAETLRLKINKALPDQAARDEYEAIGAKYHAEMDRLDNPTVHTIRTGKSEDVVDKILSSKLKNYAPMNTKVGQTSAGLLGRMEKALSPEAWNQLQADAVHRLGEQSIDAKTGTLSAKLFAANLDKLDNPVKQKLFGKSLPDIQRALSAVQQAQKFNESESGRLFIAIRYGSAGIGLTQAAMGGAAAALGERTGHPVAGAVGAAMVLMSPYAFAKMLTSNVGRKLLVRASSGGLGKTAMRQTRTAITRLIAQNGWEEGREAVNEDTPTGQPDQPIGSPEGAAQDQSTIPEPPNGRF